MLAVLRWMKRTLNGMNDFLTAEQARSKSKTFLPDMKLVNKYREKFKIEILQACAMGETECQIYIPWITREKFAALNFVMKELEGFNYNVSFFENLVFIDWDE